MRYLLLSVLVVCVIGVMIPNAFGLFHSSPIGESIIKEKECDVIGKEIDPNIECRLVLKNWNEIVADYDDAHSWPYGYDSDNDLMYFPMPSSWVIHYVIVEMDNFTIVDEVKCDGVTTGTYVKETTYPCKFLREQQDIDQIGGDYWKYKNTSTCKETPDDPTCIKWLTQSQTTIPYQYKIDRSCYAHAYADSARCDPEYELHVFSEEKIISSCYDRNLQDVRVGFSKSSFDCIIEDDNEVPVQPIHTYSTDFPTQGKIFLNVDRNELYYFLSLNVVYQINGMGELKSAAAASELEPTQSSGGCGEGTELVNGVCQLTKTSGTSQEDSFGVSNLVSVIVIIIAIVGTIALVKSRKKKSSITQPTPEKTKPKPRRKPAESRPTSSSCSNCGASLNPKAKFCGSCGTPVS